MTGTLRSARSVWAPVSRTFEVVAQVVKTGVWLENPVPTPPVMVTVVVTPWGTGFGAIEIIPAVTVICVLSDRAESVTVMVQGPGEVVWGIVRSVWITEPITKVELKVPQVALTVDCSEKEVLKGVIETT